MTQSVDPQLLTMDEILEILRNQAIAIPTPSTSSRYQKALAVFQSSLYNGQQSDKSDSSDLSDPSEANNNLSLSLSDWLVSLWMMNTPFSTASLYLDIISSLYGSAVKANLLPPTNLFSQLKADLKALGPEGWKQGIDDEIFARALRLTKNARNLIADDATAAQLVIFSLTHNLLPLTEVALLKKSPVVSHHSSDKSDKSDLSDSSDPSEANNNPSLKLRQRYLFPLCQSQRTPKQLKAHISAIVNALFRRARLPQATDPSQTVVALWAYAALRAGIPASQLLRHLGHIPLGLPVLKLSGVRCQVSEDSLDSSLLVLDSSKEYFSQVGKIFLENPPRWYAMSLRPGVRFTQVCRRIELLGDLLPDIQLFYPSEEISRAIGKKIVTRQRPFIHSVVFFRAKLTDIGRLFSKIGDLAWCYRQSARPGAPYADISERQFQLFQQTIARFTPDYEVAASGDLDLHEGDRVEILGGLFQGHSATILSHAKPQRGISADGGEESSRSRSLLSEAESGVDKETLASSREVSGVIYRLSIIGDNGIDWRITVDPRILKTHGSPKEQH